MFEKYIHQDSVICHVWKVLELKQHSNGMFALLLSYVYVCFRAWYWHLHVLDDRHNSEISENHDWPIKHYRQSWKQSLHCMEKSSVNDLRNMMASEFNFCLSGCMCMWVQLTKVIPILLHVLDLQLVAALSKDGFRVLLKPSRQDSSMPGPSIDPSVHVYHHYKHTRLQLFTPALPALSNGL